MIISIILILVSMVIIWRACDGFETASSYLGRNLSDGVRGATINAIGSSLPELLTTLVALLLYSDKEGFSFGIGTTAGSAIFNSAIIPAAVILTVTLAGVTQAVRVSRKVVLRDGLALIAAEFVLIWCMVDNVLDVWDAVIFLALYFLYMGIMLKGMTSSPADDYEMEPQDGEGRILSLLTLNLGHCVIGDNQITTGRAWSLIGLSTAVIGGACYLLVESCYQLGHDMGVAPYFVAVILAAAATSVPDTILSIKDAKNGEYDDAVSNALGSNIFDICVCLGLPLLLFCLSTGESITIATDSGSVAELRVLLLIFTAVVFLIFLVGRLGKTAAVIMLGLYGAFVVYIIGRGTGQPWAAEIGAKLQSLLGMLT